MSLKNFSVVLGVYKKDNSNHFRLALESLFNQTVCPSEIIVVVDGPVGFDIDDVLLQISLNPVIQIVRLDKNIGLGPARHIAIGKCTNDIIAVMDSDDICVNNRFELQLKALEFFSVDVVGGVIEEFEEMPGDLSRIRVPPILHDDILAQGLWRSPMNHVTIMFKRDAYYKSGGYRDFRYVEDYDMFYRMFLSGVKFRNISDILVFVRCGNGMLKRRTGLNYLKIELALLSRMYASGFLNLPIWLISAGIRIVARLSPSIITELIYKYLRKRIKTSV